MTKWILIVALVAAVPAPAAAQTPCPDMAKLTDAQRAALSKLSDPEKAALLTKEWQAALVTVAAATKQTPITTDDVTANGLRLDGPEAARRNGYFAALYGLADDCNMAPFFVADLSLVEQQVRDVDRDWVARLAAVGAGEKGAKSVNATATNAAAPKSAERSGLTDLIALALDTQNFVATDKSAVSINLNAIALIGLNNENQTAQAAYRKHEGLRRLGGTFTFGAKIPEGEITGLTGLPSAETLLDAVSWDVKVRIKGDRDPRARHWYQQMLGRLGGLADIATLLLTLMPAPEDRFFQTVITDLRGSVLVQESKRVRDAIANSFQMSVKAAGQHLTEEKGKNKFTFAVLGDKGFGDTDLTFNLLYTVVDDVSLGADNLFAVKTFSGAIALNTLVARNALVEGRATELSINGKFDAPYDAKDLPIERETVWNVVGSVTLPWGASAKIPVSLTYTNDKNNLEKANYVKGYVGISYDFGALKSLFKP
jgi:hypothetical protein